MMVSNEEVISILDAMLIEDSEMLFEHFGCEIAYLGSTVRELDRSTVGVIDAGCDELELSLVLNIPFSILALSYPTKDDITELPEAELEDWVLELSNQIMGKLKNRLVAQGLMVKLGLPEAFFNGYDGAPDSYKESHKCFSFEVDQVPMEFWMHVDVKEPIEALTKDEEDDDAFSGEIEFF